MAVFYPLDFEVPGRFSKRFHTEGLSHAFFGGGIFPAVKVGE